MSWQTALDELQSITREAPLESATQLVDQLRHDLAEARCAVAFLGEWSRGKTTLVNALAGQALLPVDVRPTTAALVYVRHGPPSAIVTVAGQEPRAVPLGPDVVRQVQTRETGGTATAQLLSLSIEAPHLADFQLVDTPGVNDLGETSKEVLYRVLPQVDLAVVVLDGTNGGLSASERRFLEADILGKWAPPVAFVVNHMDRVQIDDDEELEELHEAIQAAVSDVVTGAPVLFGSAKREPEALTAALLGVMRRVRVRSVERRRTRLLADARTRLAALYRAHLETLTLDVETAARQLAQLQTGDSALRAALAAFRAHALTAGYGPLSELVQRSLQAYAIATRQQLRRRIGMVGDLAAYAAHGLEADLEAASRAWTQAHVPEIRRYLERHLRFVATELQRSFQGILHGGSASALFRLPPTSGTRALTIDAADVRAQQRRAETARFVVPGVLSVVGGLVALPLGVAGLYAGMKLAADHKAAEQERIRDELSAAVDALVTAEATRMEGAVDEALQAYFRDLDQQLAAALTTRLADQQTQLEAAATQRTAVSSRRDARAAEIRSVLERLDREHDAS